MAKSAQRLEARRLRRHGFAINEIARRVNFSKRTVSRWCDDIVLNEKQKDILWSRAKSKYAVNFKKYLERKSLTTKAKIERLRQAGIGRTGNLSNRELFVVGVALYWAEGFKKDMRIGFANSDPAMIKLFIKWLTNCLNIPKKELTFCVTVNAAHAKRIEEVENHWAKTLKVSREQFTKPFFQQVKWKKQYEKPSEYYGVLRVRVVKSLDLLREINGYIDGLKKNIN